MTCQTALSKTAANIVCLEGLKCHCIFRITNSSHCKILRRHKQLQLYTNNQQIIWSLKALSLDRYAWSFPRSCKAIHGEPKKSRVSLSIHTPSPWVFLGAKLGLNLPQFRGLDTLDYCTWINNKGFLKVQTRQNLWSIFTVQELKLTDKPFNLPKQVQATVFLNYNGVYKNGYNSTFSRPTHCHVSNNQVSPSS